MRLAFFVHSGQTPDLARIAHFQPISATLTAKTIVSLSVVEKVSKIALFRFPALRVCVCTYAIPLIFPQNKPV